MAGVPAGICQAVPRSVHPVSRHAVLIRRISLPRDEEKRREGGQRSGTGRVVVELLRELDRRPGMHLRRPSTFDEANAPGADGILVTISRGMSAAGRTFITYDQAGRIYEALVTVSQRDFLVDSRVATHEETMAMIDRRKLMGRGIGYVDAHLLAAVALIG